MVVLGLMIQIQKTFQLSTPRKIQEQLKYF